MSPHARMARAQSCRSSNHHCVILITVSGIFINWQMSWALVANAQAFVLARSDWPSHSRRHMLAIVPVALATAGSRSISAEQPTKDDLNGVVAALAVLQKDPLQPGAEKALEEAEVSLSRYIERWEGPLLKPNNRQNRVERGRLHASRAQVRLNINDIAGGRKPEKVVGAIEDFDVTLKLIDDNFRDFPEPIYSEYPSTLVRRGLAKEALKDWEGAVQDYSKAIDVMRPKDGRPDLPLRGNAQPAEGDGLGENPLVLNFRGNALSRLGRFKEAVVDYREATTIFFNDREIRQACLSRTNEALALFGDGQDAEAVKVLESVVRRDPKLADSHVALAAHYWASQDVGRAETEWSLACSDSDTGCQTYKSLEWVSEIRRWPPSLVASLQSFLQGQRRA